MIGLEYQVEIINLIDTPVAPSWGHWVRWITGNQMVTAQRRFDFLLYQSTSHLLGPIN